MNQSNVTLEEIENKYDQYKQISSLIGQSEDLDCVNGLISKLNDLYDGLITALNLFRKEHPNVKSDIHKAILLNISKKNKMIHENLERLDANYDYEQGVLEENED